MSVLQTIPGIVTDTIRTAHYDIARRVLLVEFTDNTSAHHERVPSSVIDAWELAHNKQEYYQSIIVKKFRYSFVFSRYSS
jgi:hypothetical protein